jgi:hypothetical protein
MVSVPQGCPSMQRTRRSFGWLLLAAVLAGVSSARGQGIIGPSAGPINGAMAGASTAAPVDFGSSYWNPANLSGLDSQAFLLARVTCPRRSP